MILFKLNYGKTSAGAWELNMTLCLSCALDNHISYSYSILLLWDIPTVILFCVSVPVLSEHMTDVLPKVSTASSFRTRQFFTLAC